MRAVEAGADAPTAADIDPDAALDALDALDRRDEIVMDALAARRRGATRRPARARAAPLGARRRRARAMVVRGRRAERDADRRVVARCVELDRDGQPARRFTADPFEAAEAFLAEHGCTLGGPAHRRPGAARDRLPRLRPRARRRAAARRARGSATTRPDLWLGAYGAVARWRGARGPEVIGDDDAARAWLRQQLARPASPALPPCVRPARGRRRRRAPHGARRADPRLPRGRRRLPGQPRAPARRARARARRCARAVSRARRGRARAVRRADRGRWRDRDLRLARAVPRLGRRSDRDPADQGHATAHADRRRRARGLAEGRRRAPDDRRPRAQRPRPDRRDRLGRASTSSATSSSCPALYHKVSRVSARPRAGTGYGGAAARDVPGRLDHRRAEGPRDAAHRRARARAARPVLRRARLLRRRAARSISRSRSGSACSPAPSCASTSAAASSPTPIRRPSSPRPRSRPRAGSPRSRACRRAAPGAGRRARTPRSAAPPRGSSPHRARPGRRRPRSGTIPPDR